MNFFKIIGFVALFFAVVLHAPMANAQVASSTEAISGDTEQSSNDVFVAPVIVDGETLFFVRGFTALPASERAAKIERRILEIAQLPKFIELDYEVQRNEFGLPSLVVPLIVPSTTS